MSLSWPPELAQALREAAQGIALRALTRLYQELPATTCDRRGPCCGLLPPIQPIEILAWLHWFAQQAPDGRADLAGTLVEHFLLNAAQRKPCPWASPDSCAIYDRRFLGCRAYGLWSEALYGQRRGQAVAAQEAVVAAWGRLGIVLPDEVLAPPPAYCDQVKPAPGEKRPRDDQALCRLEERLAALSPDLPWLSQCGGDLSHALARLVLGEADCLRAKVEITRCLINGHQDLASQLLDQARAAARDWAAPPPEAA